MFELIKSGDKHAYIYVATITKRKLNRFQWKIIELPRENTAQTPAKEFAAFVLQKRTSMNQT